MSNKVVLTEGESIPVPPELQNLTAADRVDVLTFGQFSEGDRPARGRVTLGITRATPAAGDESAK